MEDEFIEDLELSVKAMNALKSRGITSFDQFMSLDKKLVTSWKGVGIRTWREIQEVQNYFVHLNKKHDVYEQFVEKVEELNLIMQRNPKFCVMLTSSNNLIPAVIGQKHAELRYTY